ncbi:MAG: DUF4147 domain-containing protein [Henriciella sp.]
MTDLLLDEREQLKRYVQIGVDRCRASVAMRNIVPIDQPKGRTLIIGAGKAAAEMALEASAQVRGPKFGFIVTRYGYEHTETIEDIIAVPAAHPVPDGRSLDASAAILALAEGATSDDRVIFLISGGGSSLLCYPIDGLSFERKQEITRTLLTSGAPIEEINFVRKHLSKIKGGRLSARCAVADQLTLIISDVVGDNPSDVASGPTLPMTFEPVRAIEVMRQYGCPPDQDLAHAILSASEESAKVHPVKVLATGDDALQAVQAELERDGWSVKNLGSGLKGDAKTVGEIHARLALEAVQTGEKIAIISGGEFTVKVENSAGRGGPNLEYIAGLMSELPADAPVSAIACDSDGIDGSEDSAGAFLTRQVLNRAHRLGLDPNAALARNDTYPFFEALDALVITGPTRTNVNDIRIILVN